MVLLEWWTVIFLVNTATIEQEANVFDAFV